MGFAALLQDRKDAIVQRWLDGILSAYPEEAANAFRRQKDPFANPVGHTLREGTRRILDAVLDGAEPDSVRDALRDIIKIRAVQEFTASQAVRFVFGLKDAMRVELKGERDDPQFRSDVYAFEARVDRVALDAFDLFVECREQVYELRVNEAKRRVAWVIGKINERAGEPVEADHGAACDGSPCTPRCEGLR
jgi:hypothetical protein